ncbi:MAG: nucleoside monophosphate kinase [Roseibacillus sp.]|nr:nucleoside monophosphate kinase [Roseibacillus sp.]
MSASAIVLLGPPASGKGTQGRLLAKEKMLSYFSTGKQLRQEVKVGSLLGKEAEPYLVTGHYVPDELALALATAWIRKVKGGWVLDGFPRTLPQAEELDQALGVDSDCLRALLMEGPVAELERRVTDRRECTGCPWTGTKVQAEAFGGACPSCGGRLGQRDDDDLENFRQRLKVFEELTLPVAEYYEQSGRLLRIWGVGTPAEVFKRVKSELA